MNFELNHTENHLQVYVNSDALLTSDLELILDEISDTLAEAPYLIVDFESVALVEKDAKLRLNALNEDLANQGGYLLLSNVSETLQEGFSAELVPSLQEAVDLMFMFHLEKELNEEDF